MGFEAVAIGNVLVKFEIEISKQTGVKFWKSCHLCKCIKAFKNTQSHKASRKWHGECEYGVANWNSKANWSYAQKPCGRTHGQTDKVNLVSSSPKPPWTGYNNVTGNGHLTNDQNHQFYRCSDLDLWLWKMNYLGALSLMVCAPNLKTFYLVSFWIIKFIPFYTTGSYCRWVEVGCTVGGWVNTGVQPVAVGDKWL